MTTQKTNKFNSLSFFIDDVLFDQFEQMYNLVSKHLAEYRNLSLKYNSHCSTTLSLSDRVKMGAVRVIKGKSALTQLKNNYFAKFEETANGLMARLFGELDSSLRVMDEHKSILSEMVSQVFDHAKAYDLSVITALSSKSADPAVLASFTTGLDNINTAFQTISEGVHQETDFSLNALSKKDVVTAAEKLSQYTSQVNELNVEKEFLYKHNSELLGETQEKKSQEVLCTYRVNQSRLFTLVNTLFKLASSHCYSLTSVRSKCDLYTKDSIFRYKRALFPKK